MTSGGFAVSTICPKTKISIIDFFAFFFGQLDRLGLNKVWCSQHNSLFPFHNPTVVNRRTHTFPTPCHRKPPQNQFHFRK